MAIRSTTVGFKILFAALGMLLSVAAAPTPEPALNKELIAAIPENFPPYYLLDKHGQPTGHAVETMARLAAIAGVRVRYRICPDWDSAIETLRSGEADLIPNIGIIPERALYFDFTSPLETLALGLFVRSANTDIHDLDTLAGKTVAVVKRNAAIPWLRNYPQIKGHQFETQEQALFALLSGEVDAFIYPIAVTWRMASAIGVDERIRQAGLPLLEIKRAVAVRKGNQALLDSLDRAVGEYTRSEYFATAYARLHTSPEPFWTPQRLLRYGGGLTLMLLALALFALLWCRYRNVAELNRKLRECRSKLLRISQKDSEVHSATR
jgi:ABC-type amino acid transport substrate-binding protein